MSATSESSDTGPSTYSSRSSLEEGYQGGAGGSIGRHQSSSYLGGSHAFSPFSFGARRSSTPTTSFLPPRFWQNSSQPIVEHAIDPSDAVGERKTFSGNADDLKSGGRLRQTGLASTSAEGTSSSAVSTAQTTAPSPFGSHVPRRTSFGTALSSGGRFTPFTAFGFSPGSPLWSSSQRGGGANLQGSAVADDYVSAGGGDLRKQSSSNYLGSPRQDPIAGGSFASADSTPAPSLPASPVQKPQRSRTVYLPGPDGICVETRVKKRPEASH